MRGRTVSTETKKKLSEVALRKTSEEHPRWKGDDVGRIAAHLWLTQHYPKSGTCEHCGEERKTHHASRATTGHGVAIATTTSNSVRRVTSGSISRR